LFPKKLPFYILEPKQNFDNCKLYAIKEARKFSFKSLIALFALEFL
jgi:hypothetical protein